MKNNAGPLDFINKKNYTTKKIRDERYSQCLSCEKFFYKAKICKKCQCLMTTKTWLKDAHCPLGKWDAV